MILVAFILLTNKEAPTYIESLTNFKRIVEEGVEDNGSKKKKMTVKVCKIILQLIQI